MPKALILWHTLHADKNKEAEREERDDSQKLAILLSRPDIYNQMFGEKSDVENINFIETEDDKGRVLSTMTPEEFRAMIQNAEYLTADKKVVASGPSYFDTEDDLAKYNEIESDDDNELIVERY